MGHIAVATICGSLTVTGLAGTVLGALLFVGWVLYTQKP